MNQKRSSTAVFILGPTATGKSKLALRASLMEQIPIINGDSVQTYKGLKIGSALPRREDLQITPHHLYAYVDKGKTHTAADHVSDVESLLRQNKNQNRWILCGGSGFYIQALEKGMYPVAAADAEIRTAVEILIEEKGWERVYAELLAADPQLSRKIHPNDHYRIRRALEMREVSRKTHGELERELRPSPFAEFMLVKVGLTSEKERLREKVSARVKEMLAQGFIEEVEGLLDEGHAEWPPLSSAGYLQVKEHLLGRLPLGDLAEAIITSHMQLIKKQWTWFKRDPAIRWFDSDDIASAHEFIKTRFDLA